jgi:hypothetical protein
MWRVGKNCRRMLLATVRIVKHAWPTTVIVLLGLTPVGVSLARAEAYDCFEA